MAVKLKRNLYVGPVNSSLNLALYMCSRRVIDLLSWEPPFVYRYWPSSLQWRHNEGNGVSNHRRLGCLLNRLSRHSSNKTSKLHVTGLCEGNPKVTVDSPHKGPVTRKICPFDGVIMRNHWSTDWWIFASTIMRLMRSDDDNHGHSLSEKNSLG